MQIQSILFTIMIFGIFTFTILKVNAGYTQSQAQLPVQYSLQTQYSALEKAGFAFHQLAGFPPDFKTWIIQSPRFEKAYPLEKANMMRSDIHRLQNGYNFYNPDQDLIPLNLSGQLTIAAIPHQNDDSAWLKISWETSLSRYIPLQIGNLWVALVINNMDFVKNPKISHDQYQSLIHKLKNGQEIQNEHHVNIALQLRARSVDTSMPIQLEGIEMWLMLVDVVTVEISQPYLEEKDILVTLTPLL